MMDLIVHGPCYHKMCYECLLADAEEWMDPADTESDDDARVHAELELAIRAGLVSCATCQATITWPLRSFGPFAVKCCDPPIVCDPVAARRRASH